MIVGICIGNNLRRPLYSATYKHEYITSATCEDSTTEFVSTGGPFPLGGREHFVKVALIDPTSVIRGPLFNETIGTAPTLLTVTTGASHVQCTTNETQDVEQYLSTIYFRTGVNRGGYRVVTSTSTTTHTWDTPLYKDVAVGDTAVIVNLRPLGPSRFYTDATATWIDVNAEVDTDYLGAFVTKLDLSQAAAEFVEFRLDYDHFCGARA